MRRQNIKKLNDAMRNEIFADKINRERAKNFCERIGLDGSKDQFGRNNEFERDERFTKLFK